MRIFTYVVRFDNGFAPNPFHGWCTLACCKPKIRKRANRGDWVVGLAPKPRGGGIVYAMRVEESLSFAEYWRDERFLAKRPTWTDDVTVERCGDRRLTIVFDRGGWSPRLFEQIIEKRFDLLTYRKGKSRRVPRRLFREHSATIDGREVSFVLADRGTHLLGGRLRLRQVTRLSEDGHQTPIITSRKDLPAIEVAYRMFGRWREENFFKYLREEFALDALVDYGVEPADPDRDVPNPRYNALTRDIAAARRQATRLCADYGVDALGDPEQRRTTLRDFEEAHAEEALAVLQAFERLEALEKRRKRVPQRVPVKDVVDGEVVKLSTGRKHLTNVLKMVAYQVESELVRAVAPHYPRSGEEGRTLLHSAFLSAADIVVTEDQLRVTLAPLSSRHRSRAVAALCQALNAAPVRFPGTRLAMRFAVAEG